MKYVGTRQKNASLNLSAAIVAGLDAHGGLFIPQNLPHFTTEDFKDLHTVQEIAFKVLQPFFAEDALEKVLPQIIAQAFNFPLVLKELEANTSVLELFHGPTAAFKDFGARFLASCIAHMSSPLPKTVLVATSGDTGGAVASAFAGLPGVEVIILYPLGKISPRQEQQLTCWDKNIKAVAVEGSFDDCQKLVKNAFKNPDWHHARQLLSANSINMGRLLPQMTYYAAASLWHYRRTHVAPNFIVPTGNLGNAVSALIAKQMGLPIANILMASNSNHAVPDFFKNNGTYQAFPTISTLANAMDVGDPSNMERLRALFPDFKELCKISAALTVTDEQIKQAITVGEKRWGEIWCPHTACAVVAREQQKQGDWIIVSTAHPAKFETIVEPLIGHKVEMPLALQSLLNKPSNKIVIPAQDDALKMHFLKPKV